MKNDEFLWHLRHHEEETEYLLNNYSHVFNLH